MDQSGVAYYHIGSGKQNQINQDRATINLNLVDGIHLFGVFDGHAEYGHEIAEYLAINFGKELKDHPFFPASIEMSIKKVFGILEKQLSKHYSDKYGGSTATILVWDTNNGCYWVANVGDSEAILVKNHSGKQIPLTTLHRAGNKKEQERIKKAGGFLHNNKSVVDGTGTFALNMTRAFGDFQLKMPTVANEYRTGMYKEDDKQISANLISINPAIRKFMVSEEDRYVVMASDGLWDVMRRVDVQKELLRLIDKREFNVELAAKQFVVTAIGPKGSKDDVAVLIIKLN